MISQIDTLKAMNGSAQIVIDVRAWISKPSKLEGLESRSVMTTKREVRSLNLHKKKGARTQESINLENGPSQDEYLNASVSVCNAQILMGSRRISLKLNRILRREGGFQEN